MAHNQRTGTLTEFLAAWAAESGEPTAEDYACAEHALQ
jgi:hypothetical protein